MDQSYIFDPIPCDKFDLLTKDEVVDLCLGLQDFNKQLIRRNKSLEEKLSAGEQKSFNLNEQLLTIKNKLFGKRSEKSPRVKKDPRPKTPGKKRVLLPSQRYPNLDIIEKDVTLSTPPACPCCQEEMRDTGLVETSEYLTIIPKRYFVVRQKRHKYGCSKCDSLVTTPAIPRVKPGSSYSDEMMVDVAMSKYLELMPIERYAAIAKREGVNLAPNSLIQLTHNLAEFCQDIYEKIKKDVFSSKIIHADETPHRMLEGDKKSSWYLWGFSNTRSSYFEMNDTRSGDVAVDLLKDSSCRYLVSDVFSGYHKAVTETNKDKEGPSLESLYCNAHARRKFVEAARTFEDGNFFIEVYKKVYRLNKQDLSTRRDWQRLYMRAMLKRAERLKGQHSSKSSLGKAIHYYLRNFEGLVRFTTDEGLPIDNNAQERQLRPPVVGRKTWYGTHSRKGAQTASVLFSIVESCKLNGVNPREYFKELLYSAHQSQEIFAPWEYAERSAQNNG